MVAMTAAGESELRQLEFKLFQELMYAHTGVRLGDAKIRLVQDRLCKLLSSLGLASFKQYYDLILKPERTSDLKECLNALTTNETFFFRHEEHWEFISNVLVPEWKKAHPKGSVFRVWSAAASIGAEAYSAAVILHEILPDGDGYDFEIEATDINQNVLEHAKRAAYDAYAVKKVDQSKLKQYFVHDAANKQYRLSPAITSLVRFHRHNLIEPSQGTSFDLVFLRNVLIYFDEASKTKVINHIASRMRRGAHLLLGGAESLTSRKELFTQVKPTIYRKI